MKINRLAVIMENKSGGVYQVALTDEMCDAVMDTITLMNNGVIKIVRPKLHLTLGKKGERV